MNLETARAVLQKPAASTAAILDAAEHLIRHGDATDKARGILVRDAMVEPTMRVLHAMPPRPAGRRFEAAKEEQAPEKWPAGAWIACAVPAAVVFWIVFLSVVVM